ncbi:hypothetical protein N8904_00995 [Flavobacteriales bacterium]|nr:hypothetical protein [Flavobacteriales bacterium]
MKFIVMKKTILFRFSIVFTALLFLSSCGLDLMVSKFNTLEYTVTPTQVEVHGGVIDIELDVNIPKKYFQKNASAEFRPMLAESAESENKVFFEPVQLQGEKVSSNGKTIGYVTGGKFTYKGSVNYTDDMFAYDLFATATATMNDNSKYLGSLKIADGVMATATRVKNNEEPKFADHTYEKETILEETAVIYFTVNNSTVRYSQKSSDEVKRLKEFAKQGFKTKNIEISSYASPEGSLDVNDKVSGNRAKSTFSYAKRLMKDLKVDGANNDELYINTSKGEDWNGFNNLVNSSDLKDKSRVLNIVRSQKDPQKREEAIRDMAEIYDAIEEDVLPKLRKATITLRVYEPKKTDEEIASLAISDPSKLDKKEMLYAATLLNDNSIKKTIYKATINAHPNDYRAYNNLLCINIIEKDFNSAKMNLGKAEKLGSNASEVNENKGIMAAMEGDLESANSLYNKSGASNLNKGILAIKMGNYESAMSKLKGDDFNATLAKILNGTNATTSDKSAEGYYLNAISNTRSGSVDSAVENLRQAINLDANLAKEAAIDVEFLKLKVNTDFQSLVN